MRPIMKTEERAWYITPPAWIMTAGFTGRCRRDEECHALAHATKRCMMGCGFYDNSPKLGLTGQRDDGPSLKLRRAAGLHPSECRLGVCASADRLQKLCRQYGVCQIHSWTPPRHRASASCQHPIKKKKKTQGQRAERRGAGWRA